MDVPVYKGHDEVAILYSNFKNMLEMRERLTEEVYGAKVREKKQSFAPCRRKSTRIFVQYTGFHQLDGGQIRRR